MNLSLEEAQLYFELMWGLHYYVNEQSGILKDIPSVEKYGKLPTKKKLKVREDLWKSPGLIDDYVKKNPESLSHEHLEIVRSWKVFIMGQFFIGHL